MTNQTNQYLFKTIIGWFLANAETHGNLVYLTDPHITKLSSVDHIPSSELIGTTVRYGRSTGKIVDTMPTRSRSMYSSYYPYLPTKITSTRISEVGIKWTKRNKEDNLFYWMDFNKLELI